MRFLPHIIKSLALLIAVVGALGLIFLSLPRLDRSLDISAIQACGEISNFEQVVQDNTTASYPVQDIYNTCLEQLGVSPQN